MDFPLYVLDDPLLAIANMEQASEPHTYDGVGLFSIAFRSQY